MTEKKVEVVNEIFGKLDRGDIYTVIKEIEDPNFGHMYVIKTATGVAAFKAARFVEVKS